MRIDEYRKVVLAVYPVRPPLRLPFGARALMLMLFKTLSIVFTLRRHSAR
jgi:hypothetical protein